MTQTSMDVATEAFRAEHEALRSNAVWFDLSDRGKVKISGRHRVRFLHGMLTHDVKNLEVGRARTCTIVTDTGKMVVDLNLINRGDFFICDVEPLAAKTLIDRLKHYKVAENVEFEDISGSMGHLSIQGPMAREVVATLLKIPDFSLSSLSVMDTTLENDVAVTVMRLSRTGEDGYDLFLGANHLLWVTSRIGELLPHVQKASAAVLETARIEAGIPKLGAELDETIFPLEAGLYHALSYSKGCYVGQEALVMMTDRGQPPKTLVTLLFRGDGAPPRPGGVLTLHGKAVGRVTSVCNSPRVGGLLGLGYVKTRVAAGDDALNVEGTSWEAVRTPLGIGWGSGEKPAVEPRVMK
ncbi:MAG: aminomethyl transferase family protein [Myxococcales bacterium]|nr:aminomethyl transferase family protein [Myxococcales bacterium]